MGIFQNLAIMMIVVGVITTGFAYATITSNTADSIQLDAKRNVPGNIGIEFGSDDATGGIPYFDWHVADGTDFDMRWLRNAGANGDFDFVQTGTGEFTFNRDINAGNNLMKSSGIITSGSKAIQINAQKTTPGNVGIEFGSNDATGGTAFFDWHVASGTDFDMRWLRNAGANGDFDFVQTGTGEFTFNRDINLKGNDIVSAGDICIGTCP